MTLFGMLLWLAGLVMLVGGLAIAQATPLGIVVSAVGLVLLVYVARRDYDPSRLPSEMRR